MKTYFTSKEVDHQWAHELAPRGRCPSHEHFEGASFYSYSTEIGRILKRNGRKAYLLNVTQYSITTSGHQHALRMAIPGDATVFKVGGIGQGCSLYGADKKAGAILFAYSIKQASKAKLKCAQARKEWNKNYYAAEQAGWLQQAVEVSAFFGLRRKVDDRVVVRLAQRIAADERRMAAEEKARQIRIEAENAETVQRWLDGEDVWFPYSIDHPCRLRAVGDEMETSKGVKVPLAEARLAFNFARKMRATGWHRNGGKFTIGEYQLDAVNESGVVAGCHRVSFDEIERFAKSEGWI